MKDSIQGNFTLFFKRLYEFPVAPNKVFELIKEEEYPLYLYIICKQKSKRIPSAFYKT